VSQRHGDASGRAQIGRISCALSVLGPWLFVRYDGSGDRNDRDEIVQAGEAGRIGCIERQALSDGGSGDHQVHGTAARLAAGRDDRGGYPAEDPCRLGAEGHRVEFVLGPGGTLAVTIDGGSGEGSAYLWDTATKTITAVLTAPGSTEGGAVSVAFGPGGTLADAAGNSGSLYLWHLTRRSS
jgi:hypothetical protein